MAKIKKPLKQPAVLEKPTGKELHLKSVLKFLKWEQLSKESQNEFNQEALKGN